MEEEVSKERDAVRKWKEGKERKGKPSTKKDRSEIYWSKVTTKKGIIEKRENESNHGKLKKNPYVILKAVYSRGHATLYLAASVGQWVRPSVRHIFEFRAVFAPLLLPNRPRLYCRVSGMPCITFFSLRSSGILNFKSGL